VNAFVKAALRLYIEESNDAAKLTCLVIRLVIMR